MSNFDNFISLFCYFLLIYFVLTVKTVILYDIIAILNTKLF